MAQPGQSNLKAITTPLLIGFGAFAVALLLQRKELNKYGYDLHLRKMDLGTNDLVAAFNNPHHNHHNALMAVLNKWKDEGMTHQVYLSRAAENVPAIDITTIKDVPMLVKSGNGDIYAYINNENNNGIVTCVGPLPQTRDARGNLYRDLHFPPVGTTFSPDREKRSTRSVTSIDSRAIVADLHNTYHHLHVSKNHAHKDTRMDNRFLIIKNERHVNPADPNSPVVHGGTTYYMYAQDRNGTYSLRQQVNPANVLQGIDYENAPFTADTFTQVKRDMTTVTSLLDLSATPDAAGAMHAMRAANPRFTDVQLENIEASQRQKLLFFSGGVAASKVPSLLPQVIGSGSYAAMNAISAASRQEGGISKAIKDKIKPIRDKFNI